MVWEGLFILCDIDYITVDTTVTLGERVYGGVCCGMHVDGPVKGIPKNQISNASRVCLGIYCIL